MNCFKPRPDPALHHREQPGLHPHRHPRNRLHAWVFLQDQVWVDYWGNEHELELMPREYAANVISFCRRQAAEIRALVVLNAALHALDLYRGDEEEMASPLIALAEEGRRATSDIDWLERTPLLLALRRRRP